MVSTSVQQPEQLKAKLTEIASRPIAKEDYQTQIARWNEYQNKLDTIGDEVRRLTGVRFTRNIKKNFRPWADHVILTRVGWHSERGLTLGIICIVGGLFGSIFTVALFVDTDNWLVLIPLTAFFGLVAYDFFSWLYHPNILKLSCSSKLYIDEYAYAQNMISGLLQPPKHVSVIKLPTVKLEIQRNWLAQESTRHILDSLAGIKLT